MADNKKKKGKAVVDDLVWFDDGSGNEFLAAGTVVEINGNEAVVHGYGESHTVALHTLKPREDYGPTGVDDMIQLTELHEGAVIHNLRVRFLRGIVYTYVGNILFSVNPYKLHALYSLDDVKQYENKQIGREPPHIFAIANAANYNMLKDKCDQVLIFSGDSGSGKTESTKLFMRYLAATNSMGTSLITEQILESNPLLESFGNAKTVINDNSSRFGKYIEVLFDNGRITGAVVNEYLLEKSRIVYQNPGDRNFHIFYEMLAGLPLEDQKEMGLDIADTFFYLNQGASSAIMSKDEEMDFQNVIASMEVLGINSEERHGIFCILAAILHIGNIYYGRTQRNGLEAAVIMNNIEVEFIAKLLQVDVAGVAKSLTQKVKDAGGERFNLPFNVEEALDSRDGLARALYSRLFAWLVSRVNNICSPKNTSADMLKIACLDIFGFETFRINGFEQFCINYANECLQAFFIEQVFKTEQAEYEREKVKMKPVEFYDNSLCIDLIAKSPVGIIHVLADESTFPQANDRTFLEKLHQNHARNELYVKPKYSSAAEFGIHHYAGEVHYQVDTFLEKNRDFVRAELLELLIYSRSMFIASLFPEFVDNPNIHMSQPGFLSLGAARTGTLVASDRKKMANTLTSTVVSSFNEQLQKLLARMAKSTPFFVRCIRPNLEKSSEFFDDSLVMSQIHSSGVIDTVKIRQSGYPIRVPYDRFVRRYFCLCKTPKINLKNPHKENSKKIIDNVCREDASYRGQYEMGDSKIFIRETFERHLEDERIKVLKENAIIIQRKVRGWMQREEFRSKRDSVVILQSYTRGFLARRRVARAKRGIVKFQALYRMYKSRQFFLHNKTNELNRISKRQREFLSQIHYSDKLEYDKVVDVTRFDIPPDLAVVLARLNTWEPIHLDYNVVTVENISQWDYAENTLPGDIDLCYFSKFARLFFQDTIPLSYRQVPLRTSLIKQKYTDIIDAVLCFKLIMRFMDDKTMNGLRQLVLGNYIVNKGIRQRELRDEIYAQLVLQTRENPNEQSLQRGWLLIALCLCCFPPTTRMNKYLLKYVSDHGVGDFNSYCQRKLLCWEANSPGRVFPPTLLEWKAVKEKCSTSITCEMSDGYEQAVEVESSSTGENLAKAFFHVRDIADPAVGGWSFYLAYERSCRLDICGDDTVLDLVSVLEQPQGFPCSMANTCVSLDRANPMMPNAVREAVVEAHKSQTHRTRLERMRQVYSEELANKPLVYQYHEEPETPFVPPRKSHYQEDLFKVDDRFYYKPPIPAPSNTSTTEPILPPPHSWRQQPPPATHRQQPPPATHRQQSSTPLHHQRQQPPVAHQMFTKPAYPVAPPPPPIEARQPASELEEAFIMRAMANKNKPPPPVPPPPVVPPSVPGSSNESSNANTLRRNSSKYPLDMTELLNRSVELKSIRDKKGTYKSHAAETTSTRLSSAPGDKMDIRNMPRQPPPIPPPSSASLPPSAAHQKNMYTVAERLSQNNLLDMSGDMLAYDRTLPRSAKKPPSILSPQSASMSRSSKARLTNIANHFEHSKGYERHPPNYGTRGSSTSAFVDDLFDPVFAGEIADLYQNDRMLDHMKGGGGDYYPNRTATEITYNNSHIYSNVHTTDPQLMLMNQLSQQQQYLQNELYSVKKAGYPHWGGERIILPQEPPPPQSNFASVRSLRKLPAGIQEVIKGFEENPGPENEPVVDGVHIRKNTGIYSVKNEWIDHDQVLHSVLFPRGDLPFLTYTNTKWKLHLRKELFFPNEVMNTTLKHIIYRQILEDLGSRTCARLSVEDRYKMQRLLGTTNVSHHSSAPVPPDTTLMLFINATKDLPLYFSRLYLVNGYAERSVSTYLAVSHSGMRLVTRETLEDELKVTTHFNFNDLLDSKATVDKFTFETADRKFVLHTHKAPSMKKLIDIYVKAAEKQARHVRAVGNYTAPDKEHLSLKKGVVVRVYEKRDLEPGLMYGVMGNYRGKFPATVVEEYERGENKNASGWGPSIVPNNQPALSEMGETEPYSMMEFAMRYYRLPELTDAIKVGSIRENLSAQDDEWTWNYINSLVVYGKEPITGSLINFNNKSLNRQAADLHRVIMKFMGDLKRDKQETNAELISTLLRTGVETLDMRDEIYCQLAKQTTNNRSDNSESCSRGWKLLMLCTAYFDCSELLRPYLNKFFHSAADPKRDFHAAANICELNLSRSFKYGGRKQMPSENELFMFLQGKNSKHQIVELPGNIQKLCKVQTSTTAYDLVKDVCQEMGLHSEDLHEEYGLFVFFEEQKLLVPIQETDYVFDTFAQIEREHLKFTVNFRKVIWFQTMRFGNNLFSEVIYNQILPDVLNGYILHFKGNRASHIRDQQTQNEISLLGALQHRIDNNHETPTIDDMKSLIPSLIANFLTPLQWLHTVEDHFRLIKHFTVTNARTKYLELISAWAYFGSSFFYIQNCEHASVDGDCVLAINKLGVHMLSTFSRDTLLSFSYPEIISTRHLRTDSGRLFVDLKVGNLMVQRVTRLETPRGKEISNLIARYIRCMSLATAKEQSEP